MFLDGDKGALTNQKSSRAPNIRSSTWRDLIPVIKVDVSSVSTVDSGGFREGLYYGLSGAQNFFTYC